MRVQAQARYIEGRGFVAHDIATGQPIPDYSELAYGATAVAETQKVDVLAEAAKTFKVGATVATKLDGTGIDKAAVIPCWVTVPDNGE